MAFECVDDSQINAAHERLNVWLRNLASPEVSLWTHIVRRRARLGPQSTAPQGFAEDLAAKYLHRLSSETQWINDLYLTLVYRPMNSRIAHAAMRLAFSRDRDVEDRETRGAVAELEKIVGQVEAALARYEPTRLGITVPRERPYSTALYFLGLLVNGTGEPMPLPQGPISQALATSRILIGWETLEYRQPTQSRFGAVLGIKEYPNPTSPGFLNRLLKAPFSFVLTQSFSFVTKATGLALLNRQYHRLRNSGDASVSQANALKSALDQLASNDFVMGNHHLSLQVLTESTPATSTDTTAALSGLEKSVAAARAILSEAGCVVAREDVALEAAFWAQLPGNFRHRPRVAPITSRNFAGFFPFHNYPRGRATGNHWGPSLMVLKTSAGSPYHFSLHASDPKDPDGGSRRDTGHTFICGPTGSGKTVFVGFCIGLLHTAGAAQVVFDKDRGLEILIRSLGGRYLPLRRGSVSGCNPLQLDPNPANRAFLSKWLRSLVSRGGRDLNVQEEIELDEALRGVFTLPREIRRLSRLLEFLDPTRPDGVHARLSRWCYSTHGDLAWAFDSTEDTIVPTLGASALVGFDMTSVLDDSAISVPLTHYLFHLLDSMLDGRRFVAWLDEFARLLCDSAFEELASDGTKTWRKRNGVMAFATQSPNDLQHSKIARTLIEQTPTKIFFPNPEAHRSDYIDIFGLTEREFELVRLELPGGSRRFLVKQGGASVVAELDLKGLEGYLKVISARANSLAEMESLIDQLGEEPASWLQSFMSSHRDEQRKEAL
jgi:type IV secretion system protein VirB4